MNSFTLKKRYKFSDIFFWTCLYLFVIVVMIDPTNKLFHMKEVVFVLLMFVTIILARGKFHREVIHSLFALLLLAMLSLCSGALFFQTDILCGIPYLKAVLFSLVVFPLSKLKNDEILRLNYIVGLSLSCLISLLLLAYVGGVFDFTSIINMLSDTTTVMIAKRDLLGFDTVMFFYKTMPFCFFALIYALRHRKYFPSIILFAPIAYGGSRTPMLVVLAIVLYLLYDRKSKIFRVAIGLITISCLFYLIHILTSNEYIQGGDELKAGVALYLLDQSSLLGHGVGAPYWDPERGEMTSTTEMTYFEMIYQYGWLLFPFVLFIFIRPFFVMYKKGNNLHVKDYAIAYLLYLINAGTNPLLINSTGMWVFACTLTIAAKLNEERQVVNKRIKISTIS